MLNSHDHHKCGCHYLSESVSQIDQHDHDDDYDEDHKDEHDDDHDDHHQDSPNMKGRHCASESQHAD